MSLKPIITAVISLLLLLGGSVQAQRTYFVPISRAPQVMLLERPDQLLDAAVITTTETAWTQTYTIRSGELAAGVAYFFHAVFEETTSATPATQRLRVRIGGLGGTVCFDSTAFAPSASIVGRPMGFTLFLSGTAAPGAAAPVECGTLGTIASPTVPLSVANTIDQPITIATNVDQVVAFTLQFGAATAGNTVTLKQFAVERVLRP